MSDASQTLPVPWYKSQRFTALAQTSVVTIVAWLAVAVSTNDWTWRPTLAALLSNIVVMLKDWASPTVSAPIAALNRSNVQTVPPSSVQNAETK